MVAIKKDDVVANVIDEGVDAEFVERLVNTFESWEIAKEYKKTESKRCNEQLSGKIAMFAEAMNVGHSTTSDQCLKLSVVESRWQDLEDARTERKEVMSACKDTIKACEQKIRDQLAEAKSKQLSLFQSSAESDDDAGVDPDAG